MTSPAVGELERDTGRVQCYDTPFPTFPNDPEGGD
jgi:hypothetical protein